MYSTSGYSKKEERSTVPDIRSRPDLQFSLFGRVRANEIGCAVAWSNEICKVSPTSIDR
jgi:hypothetical protein